MYSQRCFRENVQLSQGQSVVFLITCTFYMFVYEIELKSLLKSLIYLFKYWAENLIAMNIECFHNLF